MSSDRSGSSRDSSNGSGGHGPIRITFPNPKGSIKPSSPSSSNSSTPPSSQSSYPYPAPYSNAPPKSLQNKSHPNPFPSPAHILRERDHQDSYVNNYSNTGGYQYSSPNSSPDSSPRPSSSARDIPYTLPSLTLNPPSSSRNPTSSSSYSNPAFVTSSPTAFASTAKIPLKISAAQLVDRDLATPSPPPQFTSNPNFSPTTTRHQKSLPPQQLASPPSSPTHDPYSHPSTFSARGYSSSSSSNFPPSNFPPSNPSKYATAYMDSPPRKNSQQKSSPTLPAYQPRLPSPTHAIQPPTSPAHQSHLSHSSVPHSPIRQSQEIADEYEDEIMESSGQVYSPAKSLDHDHGKAYQAQPEPLSVHIPRQQGSPIPFEPYGDSYPIVLRSKELKKKKDLKRKDKDSDKEYREKDKGMKEDPKNKRRKKSIDANNASVKKSYEQLVAPNSPLRRSGGVRKKRPNSPDQQGIPSVNSPRHSSGPISPTSPIISTLTPLSLSSSSSVSSLPPLPPPVATPIVPSKVFSAFNPDTLHQDVLEQVELLEREFLAAEDADLKLRAVIESRYPFDKKTLLDYLLTNFILFHPEHTNTVIAPLAQKIATKQLSYAKKNPPFYAFLTLFSPPPPSRSSKVNHFPCQQILWTLTRHNLSPELSAPSSTSPTSASTPAPLLLSSWIADLLIEASPTLREYYLTELVNMHIKQHNSTSTAVKSLPTPSSPSLPTTLNPLLEQSRTEKMNFVRQIVSLVEEERKTKSYVLCNTVVPILIRGLPTQLALFPDILQYKLFLYLST